MKVGICIRYFHENYGGMLQAYATTKLLDKKNIDYEIIRYKKKKSVSFIIKSIPRLFNKVLLNDKIEGIKKKIGFKLHPDFKANNDVRMKAFHDFRNEKFIKLSKEYYGYKDLCDNASKYDAIITGSDQLWSPAGLPTNFYNLMFVPDSVRKVSYASSFGTKYIPWYQKRRTRRYLNRIEFISMRENRGAEIVNELTGRNVKTVLDPVFMLSKEEWDECIPREKKYSEKYIFAYFLGATREYREVITNFAKENNLKIVTLRHLDQYVEFDETFGDYAPYDVSPADFLNLIRYAEYVCTDSFHGSVFSIIYEKKFITFNRYSDKSKHSKNSRIDSLCQNLNLECRRYDSNKNFDDMLKSEINYKKVNDKLQILLNESNKYIDKALENN